MPRLPAWKKAKLKTMAKKKAYLVTFSVTTRIIATPDSEGDISDDDVDRARNQAVEALDSDGGSEHFDKFEEDQEMPYYPEDDEIEDDGEDS